MHFRDYTDMKTFDLMVMKKSMDVLGEAYPGDAERIDNKAGRIRLP